MCTCIRGKCHWASAGNHLQALRKWRARVSSNTPSEEGGGGGEGTGRREAQGQSEGTHRSHTD
eukprot:3239081-Pyramimonas_sp.AAC.1